MTTEDHEDGFPHPPQLLSRDVSITDAPRRAYTTQEPVEKRRKLECDTINELIKQRDKALDELIKQRDKALDELVKRRDKVRDELIEQRDKALDILNEERLQTRRARKERDLIHHLANERGQQVTALLQEVTGHLSVRQTLEGEFLRVTEAYRELKRLTNANAAQARAAQAQSTISGNSSTTTSGSEGAPPKISVSEPAQADPSSMPNKVDEGVRAISRLTAALVEQQKFRSTLLQIQKLLNDYPVRKL
ncbi:hypothetical protein PYCC9005_005782 [Savitreella phatthalungensis]